MPRKKPKWRCTVRRGEGQEVLDVRASTPLGAAIHASNKVGIVDEESVVTVEYEWDGDHTPEPKVFNLRGRRDRKQTAKGRKVLY